MNNQEAIKILSEELHHTEFHMKAEGKAPEFYEEMGRYCEAIRKAIKALERPQGDTISREALKKYARVVFDKDLGRLRVVDVSDIDNAPTVDTTCPHCDSGYAQGISDGYLRAKEDVIHSIAKQYSEHNELVPIWLSIGDIKGGAV